MALRGTLTHWKTRMLAQELGMMPCQALGILEALWHTTAELAPSGNIGRLPNQAIAMEMFYEGDADVLIEALIRSRHLESHGEHRLIVHDWTQHSDYNTRRKVDRRGGALIGNDGSPQVMTRHKSIPVPVPEPVPEPEPVKKQKITAVAVELPEWIDREVWEGFMEVRRSKRAKPTERALKGILKQLGKFRNKGHDPNEIIETSTRSNWTDVYEPKAGVSNGNYSKTGGNLDAGAKAIAFLEQAERDRQNADEVQPETAGGGEPGDVGAVRGGLGTPRTGGAGRCIEGTLATPAP